MPAMIACMNSRVAISGFIPLRKGGKRLGLLFLRVVFFCYSWLVEEKNRYPGMKFTKLVPRIQLDLYVTKLFFIFFLFGIFLGWKCGKVNRGLCRVFSSARANGFAMSTPPPWNARFMHGLGKRDEEGGARVFFLSPHPSSGFLPLLLEPVLKKQALEIWMGEFGEGGGGGKKGNKKWKWRTYLYNYLAPTSFFFLHRRISPLLLLPSFLFFA